LINHNLLHQTESPKQSVQQRILVQIAGGTLDPHTIGLLSKSSEDIVDVETTISRRKAF